MPTSAAAPMRALLLAGLALAVACASPPAPAAFEVGMSRESLQRQFGEPDHRETFVKTHDQVMGPIETFWSSLPRGARVEVWSYRARGGTVELYFVDGSDVVRGVGFAPKGAVF